MRSVVVCAVIIAVVIVVCVVIVVVVVVVVDLILVGAWGCWSCCTNSRLKQVPGADSGGELALPAVGTTSTLAFVLELLVGARGPHQPIPIICTLPTNGQARGADSGAVEDTAPAGIIVSELPERS